MLYVCMEVLRQVGWYVLVEFYDSRSLTSRLVPLFSLPGGLKFSFPYICCRGGRHRFNVRFYEGKYNIILVYVLCLLQNQRTSDHIITKSWCPLITQHFIWVALCYEICEYCQTMTLMIAQLGSSSVKHKAVACVFRSYKTLSSL